MADWMDSLFKFLGPILQNAISGVASAGVRKLMSPSVSRGDPGSIRQGIQSGQYSREGLQSGTQNPNLIPGMPPGVSGSGTTNNPGGSLNFGGGYTGGPGVDPNATAPGPPSSGFTTMGYPTTDQAKLKQGLRGGEGFQGI